MKEKNVFLKELNGEEKFWKYASIGVLVLSNILFFLLAIHENFWYDEAYTVGMINRDFAEIIEVTAQDVHSPFYYFVLKLFYIFPGMNQLISIKIFSWIFMLFYMLLGAAICRRHYNRKVEFYWLLLSGFMPAMVIQATSARMYTLGIFWVTLASYLAYSLYKEEKRSKWILFTVSSIVAVYIHTFSMLEMVVVYGLFLLMVLFKKRYGTLLKVLLSGVVVSVAYIPWLLALWRQFSRWAGWESGWHNTIGAFGWSSIKTYLAEWFSSIENPQSIVIVFSVCLIIYAGFHVWKYVRESKDFLPCMSMLIAVIIVISAIIISVCIVPCFLGRYIFPLFGGIWLFVAVGLSKIKGVWKEALVTLAIVICGVLAFEEELSLENPEGLNIYREYMDENLDEDDVIMADMYFLMMMSIYYPDAEYMIYGSVPVCMPFANCVPFTRWEQLEDVDTVWYLSFSHQKVGNLDEQYKCVEKVPFDFSYYHIVLEKYVRK